MPDESEKGARSSSSSTAAAPALSRTITLNLDILQIILSYLPRADLVSASSTSRIVRGMAIRELLSRRQTFVYGYSARFQSWCDFILADKDRLACIQDLSLDFDGMNEEEEEEEKERDCEDPSDSEVAPEEQFRRQEKFNRKPAKLVLDILRRATRLQRLSITWADAILDAVPGIPLAISRLPALKSFSVEPFSVDAQHTVTDVLATMRSRMTFLSLQHVTYSRGEEFEQGAWDYDLPRALAPHLGRLEELHLDSPVACTPEVRSATLHALKISIGENRPSPRELFEAFPNLRSLCLTKVWLYYDPFTSVRKERYAELRDSRISGQSGGHVWSSLDTVRGELMRLYLFGLTCPVRRLELEEFTPDGHDAAVKIVRYASPQKLVIHMESGKVYVATTNEASLLVPDSPGRPHVSHLTVRITIPFSFTTDRVRTTQDILDDLAPLLQTAKIEYLRVAIGGYNMSDDHLEDRFYIGKWARTCVRGLDLDLLRDTLVGAVPSLRTLAFTLLIRGETAWAIDRSGGSPVVTKVVNEIPRELIRREEA